MERSCTVEDFVEAPLTLCRNCWRAEQVVHVFGVGQTGREDGRDWSAGLREFAGGVAVADVLLCRLQPGHGVTDW